RTMRTALLPSRTNCRTRSHTTRRSTTHPWTATTKRLEREQRELRTSGSTTWAPPRTARACARASRERVTRLRGERFTTVESRNKNLDAPQTDDPSYRLP